MIIKRFKEQVIKNPQQLAIKTKSNSLTYQQLDQRTNDLAQHILKITDQIENQNDNIVLLFKHGIDMIIALLATLKARKVYVPFDAAYPLKALFNLWQDPAAKILITNNLNQQTAEQLSKLNTGQMQIINIDQFPKAEINTLEKQPANDLAYLLYTSGSTGKPKGIIQNQPNILYFIDNYSQMLSLTAQDKLTLFSTFGHDAAVMDIYGGLLNGATLYPLNIKEELNPDRLLEWLYCEKITIWHSVPTLFRKFISTLEDTRGFPDLRAIVLGGERVREDDLISCQKFFSQATFVNLYGQSEASFNSAQLITPNTPLDKIVLGKPLKKTKILLVDDDGKKVPPLRIGEIVIACEHIALGYWKNEVQTKKMFSSHPKLGRLYWTGDQGRLLLDGNIEFVGRKDWQLKIRGFRVEPGEVESQLRKHPAIKEVVVDGKEDATNNLSLCAYYVADSELTAQELRKFLAPELPDYLIPTYFIPIDEVPLLATGKVNRQGLPGLTQALGSSAEYHPPRTQIEAKLVTIWQEILGVKTIGIDDDFFDLGGHSLQATLLLAEIFKGLDVQLMLGDIFRSSTIRQLAEIVTKAEKSIFTSLQSITIQDFYPVSSSQRRMFILQQLEETSTAYNLPKAIVIEGNLDQRRLDQVVQTMITRHETLRTSFKIIEQEIVQIIHPQPEFRVLYLRSEESSLSEKLSQLVQPFNLNKAPLLKVVLIKISPEKHVLFFDLHHIIADGLSVSILSTEFVKLYMGEELADLAIQYKDFTIWQNAVFRTGAIAKQEEYWLEVFAGEIPVLNLATDYPRPVQQSFQGQRLSFHLNRQLSQKLNRLAKATKTTLYIVLLAAYTILLAKHSNQEDIVVGSPIAGRSHPDLQKIVGIFINFLAMRNQPQAEKRFLDFLDEVKENFLRAYENQEYQFEQLVEQLQIKRQLNRNPLFDTMLILQNTEKSEIKLNDLKFLSYHFDQTVAKLDLILNIIQTGKEIYIEIEYCSKLFKEETIECFFAHLTNILEEITENPQLKIKEINLLSASERRQLFLEFNQTKTKYPNDLLIHQLFEEKVKLTPDKIALVFGEQHLTYHQLNQKANQLARRLRKLGIRPESMIALVMKRSLEMIIGIFAVLKAGGAYLPIDPNYPQKRIDYMLKDSQTELVLTQKKVIEEGGLKSKSRLICLDDSQIYQGRSTNLERVGLARNLVYLIYTSGSTGQPKGVMIEHRSLHNFIIGITTQIPFTAQKSILALTTISFDIFGLEIFLPLTCGLKVVIANDEHQKDTKALAKVILKQEIDMLQMTPSRMRMLLNDKQSKSCLKDLAVIMIGGEVLSTSLLREIKSVTNARLYNMYGPTETTIWVTVQEVTNAEKVTIGKPIANTAIYILGSEDCLQPIGVLGELCIAGDSLARGYWQRPKMTQKKFVKNPFYDDQDDQTMSNQKIYRSGDLARWLPTGEIEFCGRKDDQVKIRGFRIELGEIENHLLNQPGIKEVVVDVREDNQGEKYLCAYLVSEKELPILELKTDLARELPDYMIPTYFIPIDELPYTHNGKLNRQLLPVPDAGLVSGVQYVSPTTEIEEKLVQIWQEVLGIEGIGIQHNFFDIGGNSINIIKVISLISQRMGVQVSMGELFLRPTIAEIAHNLFIENPLQGLECIISLNKPTAEKKNVFILHTWEGIIYQYKELAKLLEGEYNIYGIQAKGVLNPTKLPETLEEMVTEYISEIKAIQPAGPYIIAGYCYGNWIGYKMVQMLEDQDVPIDRMIQIDENAFLPDKARRFYKLKTIIFFPYRWVKKWFYRLITRRNKNPMDYFSVFPENKPSKPPSPSEIKNERTVREQINYLCTVGFSLKHLVCTDTYVIKSEENNLLRYTKKDWEQQIFGKVWFVEIPGGHESIFAYPYVNGLARAFKRALEE